MSKVVDTVREKIVPAVEALGYEVVDVEYVSQPDKAMHLVLYIHKDGGVSLDDCETVSNAVDALLDEVDPTDGAPYCLDVSSPGLDRPLKTARDFERNLFKEVEVKLYAPLSLNGGKAVKKYSGILTAYGNGTVTVETDGVKTEIPLDKTASVKIAVHF
jgi:ribosome maturation factor RimP